MSVIYTVGYEGTDIDRFVETLKAVGVRRLADVRAVAVSRKKGFSKRKLAERLEAEGIEYLHLIDLGDPKPGREAARAGRHEEFVKIYSEHLATDKAQAALSRLVECVAEEATCLLCFERDPKTCHRLIVADSVIQSLGWRMFHIFADEPEKYVRHAERVPRFYPRKGLAAAE